MTILADTDLPGRLAALERIGRFEAGLRELTLGITSSLSSTLNRPASLAHLCHAALPLFGTRRATAWIHDRRARELTLEASSDPLPPAVVHLELATAPAPYAETLGHSAPSFVSLDGSRTLAIPLRGRRRALGLVLLEGITDPPVSESELLDGADALGRRVSTVIENAILFDDVLRSRAELENTFNSLGDLVLACDRHGRVTNANRAFRERLSPANTHPIDRRVTELVGPELGEWLSDAAERNALPAAGEERQFDDPQLRGHFSVRATPLYGAGRVAQGIVIVARDQTERVRLQTERLALSEKLAQSQKLAALGQFVAGVAHELNNPLQAVLGHIELLRATAQVPRSLQPDLHVVYREADRAARIIRNLLVFAGSRDGPRRPVNVNALVTRCAGLRVRTARRSGIRIVRNLDPRLPRVLGDALLLQQAVLNIIINAEHAIASVEPGRGEIHILTRAAARRRRVVVEVRDSGPGVPPEVLPRIFEPFFTTKEIGQGTGLGLALAYGIVQSHMGEISATNTRRSGAVFRIVLPAAPAEPRRPARQGSS